MAGQRFLVPYVRVRLLPPQPFFRAHDYMAWSSSGLGHRPLKAKIGGFESPPGYHHILLRTLRYCLSVRRVRLFIEESQQNLSLSVLTCRVFLPLRISPSFKHGALRVARSQTCIGRLSGRKDILRSLLIVLLSAESLTVLPPKSSPFLPVFFQEPFRKPRAFWTKSTRNDSLKCW